MSDLFAPPTEDELKDDLFAPPTEDEIGKGPSGLEAVARGALQGLTFGFSDEMAGASESQPALDKSLRFANPALMEGDFMEPSKSYQQARDESRAANRAARESSPGAYMGGEIAGGVVSGLAIPAGRVATLGNAVMSGMAFGAAQGLGTSEADSLGGLVIDTGLGTIVGGAGGAAGHGVLKGAGYVADKMSPAVQKAKGAIGAKLKDAGEFTAFLSSKPTLANVKAARKTGDYSRLGRFMLDNGLEAGDSVDDVAEKFTGQYRAAGEELSKIYDSAGEKMRSMIDSVGFDPKRDKSEIIAAARAELGETEGAEAAVTRLAKYLDEVSARHGDAPNEAAKSAYIKAVQQFRRDLGDYRLKQMDRVGALGKMAEDPNQPTLLNVDDGQRTAAKQIDVELNGQARAEMRAPPEPELQTQMYLPDLPTRASEAERLFSTADDPFGKRIGTRAMDEIVPDTQLDFLNQNSKDMIGFGNQSEIQGLDVVPPRYTQAEIPGVEQFSQPRLIGDSPMIPQRPMRPDDIRNPMNPRQAQRVKTALDERIKYSRNPLQPDPASERAFYAARTRISGKIDEAIESLEGDEVLDAFKAANRQYGTAKRVADIAQDRVDREAANKWGTGLTNTIAGSAAGVYGLTTGDWETALGAMAAKKGFEKYGLAGVAIAADRVSKRLMASPRFAGIARTNPKAYQAAVLSLTGRMLETSQPLGMAVRSAAEFEQPGELDRDSGRPSNYREREPNPTPTPKPPNKESIFEKTQGSKYAQVLQNAAQKGEQSMAAAHFVLSQRDPDYRKLFGENEP